ncbi:selenocysteine-specific elongation factor, partial [Moschus berezovskii]|uniref:selenocysteine-specific elongation factor n=1 Tax=Moschus berezovskii TaxID=68408 RepID=UPI002444867E
WACWATSTAARRRWRARSAPRPPPPPSTSSRRAASAASRSTWASRASRCRCPRACGRRRGPRPRRSRSRSRGCRSRWSTARATRPSSGPSSAVVRKVKSIQMFHTPVSSAMQGDRLGICVTQFDPKLLERGLVCTPESLHTVHAALISVEKIPYFRGPLQTKAKFHITVGHETVMGRVMFFSPAPDSLDREPVLDSFDFSREYLFQEQYLCPGPAAANTAEADEKAGQASAGRCPQQQWALVEFEKPVTCPRLCLVIGSRLDADIHTNTCRLAFHGVLLHGLEDRNYAESTLPALRVYKLKQKHGVVERVLDDYSVIGRSLFKKETNIQLFVGLRVHLSTGELGVIDSAFGQSGKFKVHVPGGLSPKSKQILTSVLKKRGRSGRGEAAKPEEAERPEPTQPVGLSLSFKRYVFDAQKRMVQSP